MSDFEKRESELSELLNSASGKLITELQKNNLELKQENAKLKTSLEKCKASLAKKKAISLKFLIMQDIVERMTAVRIHRITLPYERMEYEDVDEPKGVRLEISQTMLSDKADERNVIDYSLYLPNGCEYAHFDDPSSDDVSFASEDSQNTVENSTNCGVTDGRNNIADVIYVPCLQQRHFKDIEHLRKLLPDLFFDMFGIQHNKLPLFYESLQKYLSKEA